METSLTGIEARFESYVEHLASTLGHADRVKPFTNYCAGLLLPGERKSIEPMAALVGPDRVSSTHQMMHHFVADADWSTEALLAAAKTYVLPKMQAQEPIVAWIIDDTCTPKKGKHSVGVARQYCGQRGKQDNCQVTVSTSIATHYASFPVAYQLYLNEDWIADELRREKVGVPKSIEFLSKPEIALAQLRSLKASDTPKRVVLSDAGYGNDSDFREGVRGLELPYVLGIQKTTKVWLSGEGPLPPRASGRGRKATRFRIDPDHPPISVLTLARALPRSHWKTISWREGTNETLSSRFARIRVREAHRFERRVELPPEEWLLIEWPEEESEPNHYWLSTLPEEISFERMVDLAKLRWRIDRDYQELKQELGLTQFEGRGWRGFHHHWALCIAAFGFLIAERAAFPPSGVGGRTRLKAPQIPQGFRPRGASPSSRATHRPIHCDHPQEAHGGAH
jgi:SRSO17 transposase